MQLANQLRAAGLPCFPCRADKSPAVSKGEDWHNVALLPVSALYWPSGIVGLVVPEGVVVIDVDRYKGITPEQIDASVPWSEALIQTTPRGGEHYAFRAPAGWAVVQGSDVSDIRGLDTRVGPKGYIGAGAGYMTVGAGLYRMAAPDSLPLLPDSLRPLLEAPPERVPAPPSTGGNEHDPETIRAALEHVDPGGSRSDWLSIIMALRAMFVDDEATGLELAESWSAGEYWHGGMPSNYVADGPGSVNQQYFSVKPAGGIGPGTLYHKAIEAGWMPPRNVVDTASVFGSGAAASTVFIPLLERILEYGGNPEHAANLANEINTTSCNESQRAVLRGSLKRALKEVNFDTKSINAAVEPAPTAQSGYGKNHTINAGLFLNEHYPNDTLLRVVDTYYHYTGKVWRPLSDKAVQSQIAEALRGTFPQASTVSGTAQMVAMRTHREGMQPSGAIPGFAVFENGVINVNSGLLLPHDPKYWVSTLLPYNYNPSAQCPNWLAFVDEIFSGDEDRIALLQEWLGYLMYGGYEHQKALLLLGAPRSGKGTIGRMIRKLVGDDNYTGGNLSDLASSSAMATWMHKTVCFMGDVKGSIPRHIGGIVLERFMQISGGDALLFDRKFKDSVTVDIPTRMTLAANGVPRMFDDSGALAGRMMILPVDGSHAGTEDVNLFDRLAPEIEGVAIWALLGYIRLQQNGRFTEPERSRNEQTYLAESYSPISAFLSDQAEYGPQYKCTTKEVYDQYIKWAMHTGGDATLTQRTVTSAIKQASAVRNVRYSVVREGGTTSRGFDGMRIAPITANAFGNITQMESK